LVLKKKFSLYRKKDYILKINLVNKMPQLDLMTFEIQGLSILLTFLCLFFYFYINVLPQITISMFSRFFLQNTFKLDLKSFQLKLKKLKMIILIFERGVYLFLKTSYSNISSFFFLSLGIIFLQLCSNFTEITLLNIKRLLHRFL